MYICMHPKKVFGLSQYLLVLLHVCKCAFTVCSTVGSTVHALEVLTESLDIWRVLYSTRPKKVSLSNSSYSVLL